MPHYGPFIHQVHIADGFADDCDEMIHQCLKLESLNYQAFCRIWKKMNMGCMYKGRTLGAEVAELSEEVVQVAKHYMIRDTSNFEESVAGLFIVYSLLNLQPYPGFAHLRLTADDLPAIDRIELVARRDKRHDVLYILASVLIKGPVHYCATEREHGMDHAIRKYLDGFTSIDKLGLRPKGVFYRQNEELDIIKELDTITERYTRAKMDISVTPFLAEEARAKPMLTVIETAEFDRNLRYIDKNLPRELETSLKKLISGIHEDQYAPGPSQNTKEDGDDDKILKNRKLIKERAMKGEVKPVMHLADLNERKKRTFGANTEDTADTSTAKASTSPRKSPTKSPALKTPVIKDKSQKTDFNRKRRIPISPRAFKQSRLIRYNYCRNSPESESESENESNSDSDVEVTSVQKLDKNVKPSDNKMIEKEKEKESQEEEGEEQELDIEIDTLPVIIRSENQGQNYEIEIIPLYNDDVPPCLNVNRTPIVQTYQRKKTALTKISEMPGLSIKKIDDSKQTDCQGPSTVGDSAEIIVISTEDQKNDLANIIEIKKTSKEGEKSKKMQKEKTPGIPHPEKRDMKRVHIQSKFKRQGMLPVANFEPSETIESENNMDEESTGPEEPDGCDTLDAIED